MSVNIVKTEIVFNNFFKIEEAFLTYTKKDGKMSNPIRRLNFKRGNSAAALVKDNETGELLFTQQFRYPAWNAIKEESTIEIMAGSIEGGESATSCIKREVREELGYGINHIEFISNFFVSPGGSDERIFLFYVEGNKVASPQNDDEESISIFRVKENEVAMWLSNSIHDAKTIIAVNWYTNKYKPTAVK